MMGQAYILSTVRPCQTHYDSERYAHQLAHQRLARLVIFVMMAVIFTSAQPPTRGGVHHMRLGRNK